MKTSDIDSRGVHGGLDTMREIRKIEAGAWNYLSQPVDTEPLLGTLRAGLHR